MDNNVYQDKFTRWHHKPKSDNKPFASNNAWIYTSECKAVGLPTEYMKLDECAFLCKQKYGFDRNPGQQLPAVSHDEMLGYAQLFGTKLDLKQFERQHWQICNLSGFEPKSWWRLNWFSVINKFYLLFKRMRKGENERHAIIDYPELYPIAFSMPIWVKYLVKLHCGAKPTLIEGVGFFISKLFTLFGSSTVGSVRLLGFQLLMLKGRTLPIRILTKLYKDKYTLKRIASLEYGDDHPIMRQKIEL